LTIILEGVVVKIVGVGGSPRKGGNSDLLIKEILKGAKSYGAVTEEVQLRDYQFQTCIGCEKCRKVNECTGLLDGMQLIYPKIREADGIILVSPIHTYNMTAIMKAFIDRLYCLYYFGKERPGYWVSKLADKDRKAIIGAVGEQSDREEGGMDLTLETMRRSVVALGYEVIEEIPVLGVFPKGKIKEQLQIMEKAEEFGKRLASQLS
jgi:multimeric flavodoxin WrbA